MKYCCKRMKDQVEYKCPQHPSPFDCSDNLIYCSKSAKRYGLIIHDGPGSTIRIEYCPFCGKKL